MPSASSPALRRALLSLPVLLFLGLAAAYFRESAPAPSPPPSEAGPLSLADYGAAPAFALTERNGAAFDSRRLDGRIWIANFIFTRCAGTCPVMTANLARTRESLPPATALVSFTVDPGHDTPEKLDAYAEAFGADKERWFFLTGEKEKIYRLAREGFHLVADEAPEAGTEEETRGRIPTEDFLHSTRLVLVDSAGRIRGYYDGTEDEAVARMAADARRLAAGGGFSVSSLPAVNASLNALAALFLAAGYVFIRKKNVPAHRSCMTAAFLVSTLFLASYLYYHFHAGATRFTGEGWIRGVYFTILISHTVLATAIVPLVLMTLYRAWKNQIEKHRRLARWTLPLWLYVSVTGVAVYWMLYRM